MRTHLRSQLAPWFLATSLMTSKAHALSFLGLETGVSLWGQFAAEETMPMSATTANFGIGAGKKTSGNMAFFGALDARLASVTYKAQGAKKRGAYLALGPSFRWQ